MKCTNIKLTLKSKLELSKIRKSNSYPHFYNDSLSIIYKRKVIYTEVSKVACTKVKSTLFKFNENNEFAYISSKSIHRKKFNNFKGAADFSDLELYKILKSGDFFKFCFVRNPYTRAISAYNDKIFFPFQTSEYTKIHNRILSWAKLNGLNVNRGFVTFEVFIKYICEQRFYDMDRHWMPQNIALWYPLIHYDYIGRYEEFSEDFTQILRLINASDMLINMVDIRRNSGRKIHTEFTEELAEMYYKKFVKDFHLYGYTKDSWKSN